MVKEFEDAKAILPLQYGELVIPVFLTESLSHLVEQNKPEEPVETEILPLDIIKVESLPLDQGAKTGSTGEVEKMDLFGGE
jgi:hypothetical protein